MDKLNSTLYRLLSSAFMMAAMSCITPEPAAATKPPLTDDSEGGLTAQEITTVIKAHKDKIRSCYEEALRLKPDLEGEI